MSQLKPRITKKNEIVSYFHCVKCIEEWKADGEGISPKDYQKIQVGFTKHGLQVWCTRHECNIVHIDFQDQKHPAL